MSLLRGFSFQFIRDPHRNQNWGNLTIDPSRQDTDEGMWGRFLHLSELGIDLSINNTPENWAGRIFFKWHMLRLWARGNRVLTIVNRMLIELHQMWFDVDSQSDVISFKWEGSANHVWMEIGPPTLMQGLLRRELQIGGRH